KYIDVTFADHNGAGLYKWSIRDYDDEFELRYTDGTTINHDGGGELVSGTTYRYEFFYSSILQPGEVTVEYLAGSFRDNLGVENETAIQSFTIVEDPTYGPTADLVNPADGSTVSVHELQDQDYIDIRFVDSSGQGINAASILDDDPEFTVTGDAGHVNQFDGTPTHVGGGVYRYELKWRLYCGDLEINFIAGSFEDNAGESNEAETESFYIDGPDLYGVSFDVVELEADAGEEITVDARLHNDGLVAYNSFGVRFYVSRDPHIEHDEDEFLYYASVPGMEPDSDHNILFTADLPARGHEIYNGDGVYYVGMIVDGDDQNSETNEDNNRNRGSYLDREDLQINNTEAADKPDLVGEFAAIPLEDIITPGQGERVSVRVVNLSEIPAKGLVAIQLFLSVDQTLHDYQYGGDKMAGGLVKAKLNLDELESKVFKVPFFSPTDFDPAEYYLLAKVDYQEQMEELNEDNNVVASPATYEWKRQVGEGGSKKLSLPDSSGVFVTFQMNGDGSAVIDPTDDGFDVTMTGTTANSTLKVNSKGHDFNIHDIHVTGDLKDVNSKNATLTGNLIIEGGVARLRMGDIDDDHTISIGGSANAAPVKMQFGHVTDLVLNSASPISQLKVLSWTDSDATPDRIIAPWLGKLQIAGDAAVGLQLSGDGASGATLANAKIGGDLIGGAWNITGTVGNITAGAAAADWSASISGKVSKARFNGDVNGDFSALSVAKLDIRGHLTGANLRLNPTVDGPTTSTTVLGNLKVTGWLDDSQVRAFGDIGKVTLGGMRDSNLFAGVRNYVTGLVSNAGEFSHESSIAGVAIKGIAGSDHSYLNSNIAAHLLSKVQVRNCQTNNGGTSFGIAARILSRFQRSEPGNTIKWPNKDEPDGPAPDGDFHVRLI
ncbi:MAG: CARDB domain-containing protein, partial [Phycisphaerales bacterium JB038]